MDMAECATQCKPILVITADDVLRRWVGYSPSELAVMQGNAQEIFCIQFLLYVLQSGALEASLQEDQGAFLVFLNATGRVPAKRAAKQREGA